MEFDAATFAVWSNDLSAQEFERAISGISFRSYAKGATVFELGTVANHWIGVIEGLVKIRSLSADGKEVVFAGAHAGAWFGEGSVLKGEPLQYETVALRDSRLALMDRETFLWLFDNSHAFSRFLVHQFNARVGQFIAQVEYDRMLGPTTRIARTLAQLLNPVLYPNVGTILKITQEEIGLLAGISRPIANQALKRLEAQGTIRLEYGGVTVLRRSDLEKFID